MGIVWNATDGKWICVEDRYSPSLPSQASCLQAMTCNQILRQKAQIKHKGVEQHLFFKRQSFSQENKVSSVLTLPVCGIRYCMVCSL